MAFEKTNHILTIRQKNEERFLRTRPADFDFSTSTEKERRELIEAMYLLMRKANGIGLSANQIGLDARMFVAELPVKNRKPKRYAIFNPEIIAASKETIAIEEGCLSIPETYGTVVRPKEVTLIGFDKHQKPVKIVAKGLLARIFQHETDHLNGALFIDKATNIHKSAEEHDAEL